jgi:hypothetical protein
LSSSSSALLLLPWPIVRQLYASFDSEHEFFLARRVLMQTQHVNIDALDVVDVVRKTAAFSASSSSSSSKATATAKAKAKTSKATEALPESISSVGAIKLYGFFFFFHERSDR